MAAAAELRARSPLHLRLPFAPQSVRLARRALDDWLGGSVDTAEFADDCRLVVSELVGNAVRHARSLSDGTVRVDWGCNGCELAISVTDGGARTRPRRLDVGSADAAGRGLVIIEALAGRWWVESSDSGTTVHAVLPLT